MDAHGLTLACATTAEGRAARRAGLRAALVGLGAVNGVPDGELVSFGVAGALDGLPNGTVIDATRVVDERGETLWEGPGLGVPGAVAGTILATERIVDEPAERARLHRATGADAVDLESGTLARSGRLRGVLRAVADTPERRLNGICDAVTPRGRYDWAGMARAFARAPRGFARAALDGKRALDDLDRPVDAGAERARCREQDALSHASTSTSRRLTSRGHAFRRARRARSRPASAQARARSRPSRTAPRA